jgi:hypothetical protein
MNQVTLVVQEAPITFGKVKIQLYMDIYKTRISYPLAIILLAMGDIKACFWLAQIHADLTGAFGFIADDYYKLATDMVIGSTTLAPSWETFWWAIEIQSEDYANQPDLVVKHTQKMDMNGWAELDPNTPITPVVACKINTGIVSINGVEKKLQAGIYVDNALLLEHSKLQILMKLAAPIKAIFAVIGKPDTTVRQCPLAMDKQMGRTDCWTSPDNAGPCNYWLLCCCHDVVVVFFYFLLRCQCCSCRCWHAAAATAAVSWWGGWLPLHACQLQPHRIGARRLAGVESPQVVRPAPPSQLCGRQRWQRWRRQQWWWRQRRRLRVRLHTGLGRSSPPPPLAAAWWQQGCWASEV